jgi:hypothetical protein
LIEGLRGLLNFDCGLLAPIASLLTLLNEPATSVH